MIDEPTALYTRNTVLLSEALKVHVFRSKHRMQFFCNRLSSDLGGKTEVDAHHACQEAVKAILLAKAEMGPETRLSLHIEPARCAVSSDTMTACASECENGNTAVIETICAGEPFKGFCFEKTALNGVSYPCSALCGLHALNQSKCREAKIGLHIENAINHNNKENFEKAIQRNLFEILFVPGMSSHHEHIFAKVRLALPKSDGYILAERRHLQESYTDNPRPLSSADHLFTCTSLTLLGVHRSMKDAEYMAHLAASVLAAVQGTPQPDFPIPY